MSNESDEIRMDELGRDMGLAQSLRVLDPQFQDPNYWLRFRSWVMTNAAGELARRRVMAKLTVGDVMTSWARTVVPTAMLAAALAGLLLIRGQIEETALPNSQEVLVSEIEGVLLPVDLAPMDLDGVVLFAAEIF